MTLVSLMTKTLEFANISKVLNWQVIMKSKIYESTNHSPVLIKHFWYFYFKDVVVIWGHLSPELVHIHSMS